MVKVVESLTKGRKKGVGNFELRIINFELRIMNFEVQTGEVGWADYIKNDIKAQRKYK